VSGRCWEHGSERVAASAGPPIEKPRRSWLLSTVVGVSVTCLVAMATTVWVAQLGLRRSLDRQAASITSLHGQLDATNGTISAQRDALDATAGRLGALESALAGEPDPTAIARSVQPSVFTIESTFGLGSAFVVKSSGGSATLITNFHVVQGTWNAGVREVDVVGGDRTYAGQIVAIDPSDDLATVRVAASLPELTLQPSMPKAGDSVLAFGSPEGLQGTVSNGIVSAIRDGYIQFTAPISPGSSGGPVVDLRGRVVGVSVAKVVTPGAEGLSFAIPARVLCSSVVSC
jgi:putative serine protease PepD